MSDAAYTTAEVTGTFAFMEYEDVRRMTGLYDLQRKYAALQDQVSLQTMTVTTPMMFGGGLSDARPQELEDWKKGLEGIISALLSQGQMGASLSASYAAILTDK